MSDTVTIAPLQLIAVAFDKPNFNGKISEELHKLRDNKMLRIVDGIVISKDEMGFVTEIEASDLSLKEVRAYGGIIGALLGLGSGDATIVRASSDAMARSFEERYQYGLDKEDVADMAKELPTETTAMLLLVEHLWALPLRDAMRDSGGILLAQDFLSPELLISRGQDAYAHATR